MDRESVIRYFDERAPLWDANMKCSPQIIERILDGARLRMEQTVLDVACGTGVMFPFYMGRGVSGVTAIDISPGMVEIAQSKTEGKPIEVICGVAEEYDFGRQFDACVIYNAFPHFPAPQKLVDSLSRWIRPGGTLTVAHGMSEAQLREHHSGAAKSISSSLPSLEEMKKIFFYRYDVTVALSDEHMYQVTGIKR